MAGKSTYGFGTWQVQIQDDVHSQLGCEDGVRRGQDVGGVEDSFSDWFPRSCGGGLGGRDAGREGFGMLRELRDGIPFLLVHTAGRSGGTSVVGAGG